MKNQTISYIYIVWTLTKYCVLYADNQGLYSGKVFPKLRKKGSRLSLLSGSTSSTGSSTSSSADEEEATDYVFRIITTFRPDSIRT